MSLTNRQLEIINVSLEIIATKGIQGLTIKNLAKEIGISEPAIYRHFDSKTEILLTILENFMEMVSFMGEAMKVSKDTAISKIEFMFTKIIDIFSQTPSFISVIFSEEVFKNEEKLKNKVLEILNSNEETVEFIIQKGQENNEIRTDISSKNLALIIMGALRFRVKLWDLKDCHDNLLPTGEALIKDLKLILTPIK